VFIRNLFFIFWGKQEKNRVWDCLRNKKASFCSEVKKSYLSQVLVVVLFYKGIKGKGGGRSLIMGVSTFFFSFFGWADEWVKRRKDGKFKYGGRND
jgi:hypothetical protein